ncbi:hypothetical protein BN7_2517 [Wickerhamomyces ciferrii]|uniref:Prefoldin subunit 1 n=1 Tax=Wickerhamomyces ciferrii (strain ATCC 14091 / BCRC 22168 / CBS 111 / JCM 3599 / NBRC 0793 / NRRL Y-1031 F-60-10) TaxID=1206466 RepID=K0KJ24_WICCF|nr:uncharacterized protein BN7_2517 [Wickerhamomyces ciferrii]CCH42971.1 hypothetical protein BN7_2517 [Wickerhamomyces ciferrii]
MDQQLQKNKAELQMVQVQLDRKTVDAKLIDITKEELKSGSNENRVWEGVGKIFLSQSIDEYKDRLNQDQKNIFDQTKAMKIKRDYLTTSLEKTVDSMNSILSGKRPE